jgi:hypothetical protein
MSGIQKIVDGFGSGISAKIDDGGYLRVQSSSFPSNDDRDLQIIYREFLTLNGDGVTSDMRVNGAVTPQLFYIQGEPNFDIYVTNLSILLADTNADNSLNTFGDLTALTNGCRLYYEDENGEINIGTTLQTNFDLIRLCVGNPSFGARFAAGGATFNPFFLPDAVGATADAIIPVLNFNTIFGFSYGLRLKNGTNNKLVFQIVDNLSVGLDAFNIIAYGFKRKIN